MHKFATGLICAALLAACGGDPLAGKDQDGNGVRDDIDAHIATKYADNPPLAAATRQIAKVFQAIVLLPPPENDSTAARAAHRQTAKEIRQIKMRAQACIRTLVDPRDYYNTQHEIQRLTFNTEARQQKYAVYSESLEGSVVSMAKDKPAPCD